MPYYPLLFVPHTFRRYNHLINSFESKTFPWGAWVRISSGATCFFFLFIFYIYIYINIKYEVDIRKTVLNTCKYSEVYGREKLKKLHVYLYKPVSWLPTRQEI